MHQDELADLGPRVEGEGVVARVVDLEDLPVVDAGVHEGGRDVDKEAEAGEAAAALEEAAEGGGDGDGLLRDAEAELPGEEDVRLALGDDDGLGVLSVVDVLLDVDHGGAGLEEAELVGEGEVDAGGADVDVGVGGDLDLAALHALEDLFSTEDRHFWLFWLLVREVFILVNGKYIYTLPFEREEKVRGKLN